MICSLDIPLFEHHYYSLLSSLHLSHDGLFLSVQSDMARYY